MDKVYVLIEHKADGMEICGVFESHKAAWQVAQDRWRRRCIVIGAPETPLHHDTSPWQIYEYPVITEAVARSICLK